MKLFITGGAGFIGSNFIRFILKKYPTYKIINLDKLTYCGNLDNLRDIEDNKNYKFVRGDICNQKLVEHICKDIDIIVNFAAETHVDRSILRAQNFLKTNIFGTYILLEIARKKDIRFHHISTDEVFGSLELNSEKKFDEKTSYNPKNPYSSSKAASDFLVKSYFHTYGLKASISNFSNNYGPYQFPEKFIPLFITNLIEGKKIPLYGDGLHVRDWIHVIDHCSAIDLILHKGKPGESYCIGGNCEKANIEIAKIILKEFGLGNEKIEYVKDRPGHDRRYAIDITKIKKELGWTPSYDLDIGLKNTIHWYKNNLWWWKRLKEKAMLN